MRRPNIFIAFIGLDGSGKTTLAKITQELLSEQGREVKYVWGAYDLYLMRPLVKGVKKMLVKKKARQDYKGYAASVQKVMRSRLLYRCYFYLILLEYMAEILIKVRIPLLLGRSVVADRYAYDTAANIAANLNCGFDQYKKIIKKLLFLSPKPDKVCYVSVPEEIAIERKKDISHIEYLKARRKFYEALVKEYDIITLNGEESPAELKRQLREILSTPRG